MSWVENKIEIEIEIFHDSKTNPTVPLAPKGQRAVFQSSFLVPNPEPTYWQAD